MYTKAQAAATKKYMKNNPGWLAYLANRDRELKARVIFYYTAGKNYCQCPGCAENFVEFLTVYNPKKPIRRNAGRGIFKKIVKDDFPKGIQIMCFNCIAAIGHYGKCPHSITA